jgi:hypothetical protein
LRTRMLAAWGFDPMGCHDDTDERRNLI